MMTTTTMPTLTTVPTTVLDDGIEVLARRDRFGRLVPVCHMDKKWVRTQRDRLIAAGLGCRMTVVFRSDVGAGEYVVRVGD